jgi:hypothetical protein
MGPDHHRVFMYTPDLSVSNQKVSRQRRPAVMSDPTDLLGQAKSHTLILLKKGEPVYI